MRTAHHTRTAVAALSLLCLASPASAADWSDTAIGVRVGKDFREPFNPNRIGKTVYCLTHASGTKYGGNFFNVDFLQSDSKDPAVLGSNSGAQEAYVVYRHTLDLGKLSGRALAFGAARGVGAADHVAPAGQPGRRRLGRGLTAAAADATAHERDEDQSRTLAFW